MMMGRYALTFEPGACSMGLIFSVAKDDVEWGILVWCADISKRLLYSSSE